jgi:serine/threonine protein kinase
LNDEPAATTFQSFLQFWDLSQRVLHYLDPSFCLDLFALVEAHLNDLRCLEETFNYANTSIEFSKGLSAGSVDLSRESITSIVVSTPVSYLCRGKGCLLEVFPAVQQARFQKFVIFCQKLPKSPRLLGFLGASQTPPYTVAHEACEFSTLEASFAQLDPAQLSAALLSAAKALEFLHFNHIVHRFLSPDAVLVCPDGQTKIANLFWAAASPSEADRNVPFSRFSSPELLTNPGDCHPGSDVYSFTLLLWRVFVKKIPFDGMSSDQIIQFVAKDAGRPEPPPEPPGADFFSRGWNPVRTRRPPFAQISRMLQAKEIVPPGDSTPSPPPEPEQVALKTTSIDFLSKKQCSADLSDEDIAELCVAAESDDAETRNRAAKGIRGELQRDAPFSSASLVRLISLSSTLKDIRTSLFTLVQKLPNRIEFSHQILNSVTPECAVQFLVHCGLHTDELARLLLDFGSSQSESIANQIVDAVRDSRADSNVLFDCIGASRVYYTRGLDVMWGWSDDNLLKRGRVIPNFLEGASDMDRRRIRVIVDRVPLNDAAEFDRECQVLAKLVEWGYHRSVLRFAESPAYGKRMLNVFLPLFKSDRPGFLLKLCANLLRLEVLRPIMVHIPIPRICVAALLSGDFELAARICARITFSPEMLGKHLSVARRLEKMLAEDEDVGHKSAICLCLVPFCLLSTYVPNWYVVETVAILLQSDEPVDVARALVLGVAIGQRKELAENLADPYNVDAACRFFRSDEAPLHVLYTAVRFVLAVAPHLKFNEESTPILGDAVEDIVQVALKNKENARLLIVAAQVLIVIPRTVRWNALLQQRGLRRFAGCVKSFGAADAKIMELMPALAARLGSTE